MIIATLAIFNLQCSWTPEVETVLYEGPECVISLTTSHALKQAPTHPAFLSETLIAKILNGMTISQEEGILQQLLLSNHHPVPAFSQSQIIFLAPHVSRAFSQVTPEEVIHFKCPPTNAQHFPTQGMLAAFPPSTLLLTLENLKSYPGVSQKMQNTPRSFRPTSLVFTHQEASIRTEEVQNFMTIPSTSHGIIINYQNLEPLNPVKKENKRTQPRTRTTPHKNIEPPMTIDSLNSQLRELQKIVDQQAEEIRRLQDTSGQ
ncbi:hypothetical protein ACTRXD_22590 [Nitrospira sp. T9]|uniref:hypothetical protein n=1 Tax=unclassified Nitrospira TaxID=2652172 RepID=UPI003F992985